MIKEYPRHIISKNRLQDSKLKTNTFNMYDSSQTDIVNIFAGKEGWGTGLIYGKGREMVKDKFA